MRTALVVVLLVFVGFAIKLSLVEAERYVHVRLVDACLAQYSNVSREQENACYGAPDRSFAYRLIAALSFQPEFWKNTSGRCVGVENKQEDYFGCGWWNRRAL